MSIEKKISTGPNPELRNTSVFVRRLGNYALYDMYDEEGDNPVRVKVPSKPMFSDQELVKFGFKSPVTHSSHY